MEMGKEMGITAIFALLAVTGWVAMMILAGASWRSIVAADPAYAGELYISPSSQVLYRLGPLNSWVLFRRSPPLSVARRIQALRIVLIVPVCAVVGFVACLAQTR